MQFVLRVFHLSKCQFVGTCINYNRNFQGMRKTRSIGTHLDTDRIRSSTSSLQVKIRCRDLASRGNVGYTRFYNLGWLICEIERFDGSLDRVIEGVGKERMNEGWVVWDSEFGELGWWFVLICLHVKHRYWRLIDAFHVCYFRAWMNLFRKIRPPQAELIFRKSQTSKR